MKRIKEFLLKYKYESSIFAALSLNFLLFFTKDELMSDIMYPMHLVDTKIGFLSRTLVGSVTGLLWEHPTKNNVVFLHITVILISFILSAVIIGSMIKKTEGKTRDNLFLISLAVCVLPYGFKTYVNLFELLDIYWLLFTMLCFFAIKNKITAFLIPVFIVAGLWAHSSFLFAFMPVVYVLCLDKCIREKNAASKIMTAVMVIVSVIMTLYFVENGRNLQGFTYEELVDYISIKAGDKITAAEKYLGGTFRPFEDVVRIYKIGENVPEEIPVMLKSVIGYFLYTFRDTTFPAIISDFIIMIPIALFFGKILKDALKADCDKKNKFIYFLCLISPVIQFISCFLSSDTSRWLSYMAISDLLLLLICTKDENSPVAASMNSLVEKLKQHRLMLTFAFIFYLNITFVW